MNDIATRLAGTLVTKTGGGVAIFVLAYIGLRLGMIPAEYAVEVHGAIALAIVLALRAAIAKLQASLASNGKPESGRVPILGLVILVASFTVASCVTVHQRDEYTIAQIKAAITRREADWKLIETLLGQKDPALRDRNGARALNESELDRLRGLLRYEEAKSDGE